MDWIFEGIGGQRELVLESPTMPVPTSQSSDESVQFVTFASVVLFDAGGCSKDSTHSHRQQL